MSSEPLSGHLGCRAVAPRTPEAAPDTTPDLVGTDGTDTVRCQRCGWQGDKAGSGKGQCGRCGCFLPTNTAALVHGGRRFRDGMGTPLDEARRAEIVAAVISDLGGEDEISAVLRQLVADFGAACVLRNLAWAHIASVGPLTKAGRQRAVVDLYLKASARVERLAARIGTQRRAAPVPSLQEYLDRKTEDAAP